MKYFVILVFIITAAVALPATEYKSTAARLLSEQFPKHIDPSKSSTKAESTWEDALELVTVSIRPITTLYTVPLKDTASKDANLGPKVVAAYNAAENTIISIYGKVEAHIKAHTLTAEFAEAYFQEVSDVLLGEPQKAIEELYDANPNVGVLCLAYAGAGIGSIQVYAKRIVEIVADQK